MGLRNNLVRTGLLALTAASPCAAQVDLSAWPEVRMEVMAVAPDGTAIPNLPASAIQIRSKIAAHPAGELVPTSDPQSVCILIDASDIDRLSLVKSKATRLIKKLPAQDDLCVAAYSAALAVVQPLTGDRAAVLAAVDAIRPTGGTHLHDALLDLSFYMRGAAHHSSRAIILFSDGRDDHSAATRVQLKQGLEAEGSPMIHFICLPQQFGHARRKQVDPAEGSAFLITGLTGGMTYFPHLMSDLNALAEALPEAMQTRYILTYQADNPSRDGHEEHPQLQLDHALPGYTGRDIHVRAPEGYFAPSN